MRALAVLFVLLSLPAYAAEPPFLPQEFIRGIAPSDMHQEAPASAPDRESPQVVQGSGYTVVMPIYAGADGNTSFLRFPNGGLATSVTSITIVGYPSGFNYGTPTVTVPSGASPQYSIYEILDAAGLSTASFTARGDLGFSLYLRNADRVMGFQHVIYNDFSKFFENASACAYEPGQDYSFLNQVMINIHTSRLAAYPSTLFLHNFNNVATTYTADIHDARTGALKGTYTFQVLANTSYSAPFTFFEDAIGWIPASNEQHANVVVRPVGTSAFRAILGQAIYNANLNAYVNMTQVCRITH